MKFSNERIKELSNTSVDDVLKQADSFGGDTMDQRLKWLTETRDEMIQAFDQLNSNSGKAADTEIKLSNALGSKIRLFDSKIETLKVEAQEQAQNAVPYEADDSGWGQNDSPYVQIWESVAGNNKGQKIKVLSNKASLKKVLNLETGNLNWRDYMRFRIAGYARNHSLEGFDDPGSGFHNVMSTTSDTSLVPEPLSAEIIDLARSKARVFQAGAQTVPMTSKTLTIARVTGDPTVAWKAENAAHTASDVTTEPLTFTAKTLIASVKMSVELSEDSPNASQIIEDTLASSLALELDRVALIGSGTDPEPQGIFGATNVQTVDLGANGAAITDYDPFSDAYQKVLEANGVPGAVIFAPRTWGTLDKLKDTTNQPLQPPMSFQQLLALQTTQIPIDQTKGTSVDASHATMGDFLQLLIGLRTDLRIEVSRVASDAAGSAWENLQVWVRAYLRSDVQLAHPDHFTVIDGIIP